MGSSHLSSSFSFYRHWNRLTCFQNEIIGGLNATSSIINEFRVELFSSVGGGRKVKVYA